MVTRLMNWVKVRFPACAAAYPLRSFCRMWPALPLDVEACLIVVTIGGLSILW